MKLRTAATVVVLIVLHLLLRVGLGLEAAAPDLALVALLIAARPLTAVGGGALGMLFGVLEDSLSLTFFGTGVFAMTAVGAAGARFRDLLVDDSAFFLAIYFLLGKGIRDMLAWTVSDASLRPPMGEDFLVETGIAAVYAAAVGVAVRLTVLRPRVGR